MDWFTQICLAIKHIHDKKILHRDLKSQNIFLTKNGLIKLGDFGIAKCLNFTLDKAKTIVGTPFYLSPEIIENKPYSFKSDIWSLGVLLYEMVCLKMPFDATSLPMLYMKIVKGMYNSIPGHYSKDLKNLIKLLLNVNVEKRLSIKEILKLSFMKKKIRGFLSEMDYNKEFSTTLIMKIVFN
jgi:NIMA (never in mitosis gene a)-related kinase